MMKHIFFLTLYFGSIVMMNAQIGIMTASPDADALLDLQSEGKGNKGLLLPKVSLTETTDPDPMISHIQGMVVYNTNTSAVTSITAVTPGFYVNDGTKWNRVDILPLEKQLPSIGDIKYSAQSINHDGWYLLNGRNVSSLPSTAQDNAILLGFATTLPNVENRFLRMKEGVESIGGGGGSSLVSIARNNLPNEVYYINTGTSGSHSHTYTAYANTMTASGVLFGGANTVNNYVEARNTTSAGNHNHTFSISSGGGNQPFNITPSYISSNVFVYLGE